MGKGKKAGLVGLDAWFGGEGRIIGDSHFLYSGLLYVQNTLEITLHLKNLKSLSFKIKNTSQTTPSIFYQDYIEHFHI